MRLTCVWCDKEFEHPWFRAGCSSSCSSAYQRRNIKSVVRTCLYCNTSFETKGTTARKYCDEKCRTKHRKVLREAERQLKQQEREERAIARLKALLEKSPAEIEAEMPIDLPTEESLRDRRGRHLEAEYTQMYQDIGKAIQVLREQSGLSREELAKLAQIRGEKLLSKIENGHDASITIHKLARIARALGVHPFDLMASMPWEPTSRD